MLEVRNLSVSYGPVRALEAISLDIRSNEIVSLVGPNGAGKSTALKAICGLLHGDGGSISTGTIRFEGTRIDRLSTDKLARMGLSLVPEGRRVFPTMTVRENLEVGSYARKGGVNLKQEMTGVFELFPRLLERLGQKAGTLSSGEQQMLAIGRALMLKPRLLMADEPSLGLSPNFVDTIFDTLLRIKDQGTPILLVEQNTRAALDICDRAYVFEQGRIVREGKRTELLSDDQISHIFLGG